MTCISCTYEHNEKFCPQCGEQSNVNQITFSSILKDAVATLTNMDKGFLFNVKSLTLNPRKVVTDYLLGKRKSIFNPVSFLIIAITVFVILDSLLMGGGKHLKTDSEFRTLGLETGQFLKSYFRYFWILATVWLGISTKLVFGKYNYAEHMVISAFIVGQATIAGMGISLALKVPLMVNPLVYLVVSLMVYHIFKTGNSVIKPLFKSLAVVALYFVQVVITVVIIVLIHSIKSGVFEDLY